VVVAYAVNMEYGIDNAGILLCGLNKYGSADKFVAIGKAVLDAKLVYSDRGVEDSAVI